ncbi:unnamed protein product, partial [Hapterophycus canaliculatus]
QAAKKRRVEDLEFIRTDPQLMNEVQGMLWTEGVDQAAAKASKIDAANTRASRASLASLKTHAKTTIGRIAYTTAPAVVAGAGEHTCDPSDPCRPGERCHSVEPGGASFSDRAESVGIRWDAFSEARARMHNTNHDLAPQQAYADGCYLHNERKVRSDVTNPEVMELARLYWHSDDVSRATGNSGTICRESRKRGAPSHPRRQLMHKGDEVWRMFLKSHRYLALKKRLLAQDSSFTDPSRATFLTTRCGCLSV